MDGKDTAVRPIKIFALGRFELQVDGAPLRFLFKTPRRPLGLLHALLCGGSDGVRLDALSDELWPELEPWSALRVLHVTIYRLRRLLQRKSAVVVGAGRVALDPEQCWVDAWEFEHAIAQSKDPTELLWALRFYRGMFLGDGEQPMVVEARERLCRKFNRAVLQLGQGYERIGDTNSAIDLYLMALEADDSCEDVHRALMRCLALEGQASAVRAAFERCRAMLRRRFGALPSPLTEQLFRQSCAPLLIEAAAALAPTLRTYERGSFASNA